MFTSPILLSVLLASAVQACTRCPHPGSFLGQAYYPYPTIASNNNTCGIAVNTTAVAALIPIRFFDPPDESPCGQTIQVYNTASPKRKITATIVGGCQTAYCGTSSIMVTPVGLGILSPDSNPNEAPFAVNWTITGA